MISEQTQEYLNELHELSPEPEYNGRDYFDSEELKQERQKYEHSANQNDWTDRQVD